MLNVRHLASLKNHPLPTSLLSLTLCQTIPPTSLPALFGASLEPILLASLIPVLATATTSPDAVRAYMCALTRVPRFKTVAQFLSRAEQDAARAVWEAVVRSTDDAHAEDVEVAEAAHVWGFSDT
jgi:hypothetical protein